jgi:hypothetical protein
VVIRGGIEPPTSRFSGCPRRLFGCVRVRLCRSVFWADPGGSAECGLLAVSWRSRRHRVDLCSSVLQEFCELLVTDLCLAQDAFERSALQPSVKRHRDRGMSRLTHDGVACGLSDVLPAGTFQKTDKLPAGKDRKAVGQAQRLCAGLEVARDLHLDWHDGRGGIDVAPVGRVFEQQLDRLDEVGLGLLDRLALADDVQLKAAGHVPGALLVNRSCQPHRDSLAVTVHGRDDGREPLRACWHLTVLKLRCDTRSHIASERIEGGSTDVEGVAPGQCWKACPRPDVRRWQRRGSKHQGKSPRSLLHPGATGKGKTGRVNTTEPSTMPRHKKPLQMGRNSGVADWPLESGRRQPGTGLRLGEHRRLGVRGHPPRSRLECAERGNPVGVQAPVAASGTPTVRKA